MAAFFSSLASRLRQPWSSPASPSSPPPSPSLSSDHDLGQVSVDETLLCVFRLLDQNNDGFVSVKEFCEGLHKLGVHIPHHQMFELLKFNSSSGLLSFHQFQALYVSLCANPAEPDLSDEQEDEDEGEREDGLGSRGNLGDKTEFREYNGKYPGSKDKLAANEGKLDSKHVKFHGKESNFRRTEDTINDNKENLHVNEKISANLLGNGNNFHANKKDSSVNEVKFLGSEGNVDGKSHFPHHNPGNIEPMNIPKSDSNPNPQPDNSYGDDEEDMVLLEAFNVYDRNADGFISLTELQSVLCSLGFSQCRDTSFCLQIMKKVDSNGDGLLDFSEFKNMMVHEYKNTAICNI